MSVPKNALPSSSSPPTLIVTHLGMNAFVCGPAIAGPAATVQSMLRPCVPSFPSPQARNACKYSGEPY